MWVLVAYDITTDTSEGRKRLRKVAQLCVDHGQRVQKSVFECWLDEARFEEFRRRLLRRVRLEEDSLRIYRLPERPGLVEAYGVSPTVDFRGPLVV